MNAIPLSTHCKTKRCPPRELLPVISSNDAVERPTKTAKRGRPRPNEEGIDETVTAIVQTISEAYMDWSDHREDGIHSTLTTGSSESHTFTVASHQKFRKLGITLAI